MGRVIWRKERNPREREAETALPKCKLNGEASYTLAGEEINAYSFRSKVHPGGDIEKTL